MQTQAYFENIQQQLLTELGKAQQSIYIAVAWFTDNRLFEVLVNKATAGIAVELLLMNDEINNNSGIDFDLLATKGGKVWKIGSGEANDTLMHNKFCVIDADTVINGSYNWTRKAQQNHESITVITENAELAEQFIAEFQSIKEKYFGQDTESVLIDYGKVCIRLETLKNAILLDDKEDIAAQLKKISSLVKPANKEGNATLIHDIIHFARQRQYGDAVRCINEFTNKFKSLTVYVDTEIAALKLEIKALELQISSLEDERTEIEKLIHEFEVRHTQELGGLILKLLSLRREKLKEEAQQNEAKQAEFEEAEKDFTDYSQSYEASKDEHILPLDEEQRSAMKTAYRKASKLCHPDVVAEEHKHESEKMFKDLKDAYDKNDLRKVNEILTCLEKGIFHSTAEKVDEKKKLKSLVERLRLKRNEIEQIVESLKKEDTFKTIAGIGDWDEYFASTKEKLSEQLKELEGAEI